jgi:HSP20 family protein
MTPSELDRLNDLFFSGMMRPLAACAGQAAARRPFTPATDVREEAGRFVLQADLPGVRAEDVKLTFEDGVLTVAGERREGAPDQAVTQRRAERAWGAFERRFSLPREVDGQAIEASFADGVLTIVIPKRADAQPRKIEIKAR